MPRKGFKVVTFREDIIEKARAVFEQKKSQLPEGTSFSKFLGDVISKGLETTDESNPRNKYMWEY